MKDLIIKILRYFLLNKKVRNKDIKSFFLTLGIYIAIGFGVGIEKLVLGRIPLVGNLLYNVSSLYTLYAWIGIILAAIQCFGKEDYNSVNYVTSKDFQKLKNLWELRNGKIVIIASLVLLCIIPNGNRIPTVKNDDKENSVISSEAKETEKVEVEVQKESISEIKESEADVDKYVEELQEFYSYARGFWKNDEIHYTFTKEGERYLFFDSNSIGDHMTNKNYYMADYHLSDFEMNDDEIKATLVDVEGIEFDVVLAYDGNKGTKMQFRKKEDTEWIELENNNCYSLIDLMNKENYTIFINDDDWISEVVYTQKNSEFCFLECFEYFEGEELLLRDGFCRIWGVDNGIVFPLTSLGVYSSKAKYDSQNGVLWDYMFGAYGRAGTYTRSIYNPEEGTWSQMSISESEFDSKNMDSLIFCEIGEDYEQIYQEKMQEQLEEKMIENFVVDDSMIIDTPVEEYEGIYYKEYGNIYISGVDEDVMTVNHTEESSYTIFGILGRQTDGYPEGTAVYAGSVSADGRYGHTGNYKGQVAVVLQPNGDVFVKHLSGDTVYQEGFFSKEEGKY